VISGFSFDGQSFSQSLKISDEADHFLNLEFAPNFGVLFGGFSLRRFSFAEIIDLDEYWLEISPKNILKEGCGTFALKANDWNANGRYRFRDFDGAEIQTERMTSCDFQQLRKPPFEDYSSPEKVIWSDGGVNPTERNEFW
jgi:hypothetical protein